MSIPSCWLRLCTKSQGVDYQRRGDQAVSEWENSVRRGGAGVSSGCDAENFIFADSAGVTVPAGYSTFRLADEKSSERGHAQGGQLPSLF